MLLKNDCDLAVTMMLSRAILASGETLLSVMATTRDAPPRRLPCGFDRRAAIGRKAYRQHRIALPGTPQGVDAGTAGRIQKGRLPAKKGKHLREMVRDGILGPQAEAEQVAGSARTFAAAMNWLALPYSPRLAIWAANTSATTPTVE